MEFAIHIQIDVHLFNDLVDLHFIDFCFHKFGEKRQFFEFDGGIKERLGQ